MKWKSVKAAAWVTGICVGCCFLLAGCDNGPRKFGVKGTVKLDGTAIEQGSISFIPSGTTKGPTGGGNIVNGAYSVSPDVGLVPGKYRVEIHAQRKTGKKIEAGSPSPPGTMVDEVEEAVPPEYNTKSVLERQIEPEGNVQDFNLKTKQE